VPNTRVLVVFPGNGFIQGQALPGSKRKGSTIFWFIAIALTAIACAALLYAGRGRMVNAGNGESAGGDDQFRLVLAGIEADLANSKISAEEANGAKGELAREIMRLRGEVTDRTRGALGQGTIALGLAGVAVVTFATYAILGSPGMGGQPLASRPEVAAQTMDLATAVERIEAQLLTDPQDLRGWTVLAPALVEMGRFADAAGAYRRIIDLSASTAQLETDLAEALLLAADGAGSEEAMASLRRAIELDPNHVQARLYLAAELTRMGEYDAAAVEWQAAIDQAQGEEPWLPAARQGLAVAQNDGVDTGAEQQADMIRGMVDGLSGRLYVDGGSVEEWTQLVRSYIVLGDLVSAQEAFDRAVAAYPLAFDRGELDSLALGAGLTLNGVEP